MIIYNLNITTQRLHKVYDKREENYLVNVFYRYKTSQTIRKEKTMYNKRKWKDIKIKTKNIVYIYIYILGYLIKFEHFSNLKRWDSIRYMNKNEIGIYISIYFYTQLKNPNNYLYLYPN